MKLREVFRYELEYHLRNASTWIYAGILFVLAVWISVAMGADGDGGVHANAPERLAEVSALVGMLGFLVTAALFGDAAVRDIEVEMDPLLFTSPISKAEYLGGRFLGALAVNALVVVAIPLGLLTMTGLLAYSESEVIGPFRVSAYVQPFLVFVLPNLVVVGVAAFTIGILARRALPVYFGPIGLFIETIVARNYVSDIEGPMFVALADPFGMVTLGKLTQLWTVAERNTWLVGLPLMLAWDRALWLTFAAAALTLLHRRFRFAHLVQGAGGSWLGLWLAPSTVEGQPTVVAPPQSDRAWPAPSGVEGPVAVPRIAGSFGFRTTVRQTLAVARRSLADIAASRWSVVVLLACTGLTMLWGWNVADTVFDTSTWPITLLVAETVLSERIGALPYVLIALYAGELVWREREVGEAGIAGATPVPEGAALVGRFLALTTLIAVAQAASMVGGLLIQALQGYYHFELGLYVRILFGLKLAEYILIAALAMTIHVIVNHKYLAHIVVLMAIVSTRALPMLGSIRHHLLLYGTDPGWTYSDMNGFGPFIGPLVWFKLYWAAWAVLLTIVAILFWVRGDEPGIRRRLRQVRARFIGPVARTAGAAIALIVLLGGFIFYNTNILNEYRSVQEAGRPQAEYERRYKRFEDLPQPVITAADLRVEIYPDEPAVDLRGTYRLVNRTGTPIDSVHVLFRDPNIQARALSFDRAARPVLEDTETRYRIFALERALEPGDAVQLTFDVAFRPRGFPNSGMQTDVVSNGAYFNRSWLPFIGYQPMFELSEAEPRQRFGLGPQPPMPGPDDADARRYRDSRDAHNVHMNAVVGTSADQIAVTPGVLRRSWTERGRRYFHYETNASDPFSPTFFSAKYAVLEDRWAGSGQAVDLRIYHHPAHRYVLDRMLRSMKASLDYYTTQFGPYTSDHLRIVQTPRYGNSFGTAHLHTIAVREHGFFSRVREGEIDQPFYGIAHEIAHQWWPLQARDAAARGRGFLSESLANYSAMMVTENTYGPEVARRVYDFQMGRYLNGRASQAREVPLLEVEDQSYIAYRKGAIAMYTLREHIGEERVNIVLRRYLEKNRNAAPPYATSLDLYAELRAVTPDSLQSLLVDLFETVTLWDVKTERVVVQPTGTGEYGVAIDVVAKKMRADSVGNETEVPMDDFVEIGVFAQGKGDSLGAPLYLKQHRIRSGKQTISITVPREPARAGIDPSNKLIDRNREDNVVDVKIQNGDAS